MSRLSRATRNAPEERWFTALPARKSSHLLRRGFPDHSVRIKNELLRRALVEVPIAYGRVVERNDGRVDSLGDLNLVVQNGLHQLTIVPEHRALTRVERVRLCPAQSNADPQVADPDMTF